MHVWPIYGVLTGATVAAARWAYRRDRRRSEGVLAASVALLGAWVITQVGHWWVSPQYNQFFPVTDYIIMTVMALAWRKRFSRWKAALVLLFLAQCLLHAYKANSDLSAWWYDFWLNRTYEGQLACIWVVVIGRWLEYPRFRR